MAKVLIFNNFLRNGQQWTLAPRESKLHKYTSIGPGRWQANPYARTKHMRLTDLLHRMIACTLLWIRWRKYDVLVVDGCVTALLVSFLSLLTKGNRKMVVSNFNVPRRRTGFWKWLAGVLYRRVDVFIVHSRYDIDLISKLYDIPHDRFMFLPFLRGEPADGEPSSEYLPDDEEPFIFSFGHNARDYETFLKAIEKTGLNTVVVARRYNLEGLTIPENVRVFYNIQLDECDRLVRKCKYTVFTFDGSEPSCGQISIVTSYMLGKPVICTNWHGVDDYVNDGVNGMLVNMRDVQDLRDTMVRLNDDGDLYSRLSAGANEWARQHCDLTIAREKIDDLVTTMTASS